MQSGKKKKHCPHPPPQGGAEGGEDSKKTGKNKEREREREAAVETNYLSQILFVKFHSPRASFFGI